MIPPPFMTVWRLLDLNQFSQLMYIYLMIRATHLRLLLLRMFVLQVGRQWVMGQEGRAGQKHKLFMIVLLQEVRLCLCCLRLT